MYQLIYISSATQMLTEAEFMEVSRHALDQNNEPAITGTLIYKDGSFMGVLEGEQEIVAQIYENISHDPRHTLVSIIQEGPIAAREYDKWVIGYSNSQGGECEITS